MAARPLVVGLGANVGSREALLRAACELIARDESDRLVARSSLYDTAPLGPAQPRYLNAAVRVETARPLEAVLTSLGAVERALGRVREARWGPRTADLDLLWCRGERIASPTLTVPHEGLTARDFALRPLLEVAPEARDPRDGALLSAALAALAPDPTMRVRGFAAGFPCEPLRAARAGFATQAGDRADLLAAAAECLAAGLVDPAAVSPAEARDVAIAVPEGAGDDARMFAWLAAVDRWLGAERLALRRAVVFEDSAGTVRGRLFGERHDPSRHGPPGRRAAVARRGLEVGAGADGIWRAQVVLAAEGA